jgi:hypothetical protein
MSLRPRLRLPRRRSNALTLESLDHEWYIYTPDPDIPLVVAEFGDAVSLAMDLPDALPIRHEALLLLDEHRHITAILLDAPAEVGLFVGHCAPPGAEAPFCQTLCVVVQPSVPPGPPTDDDRHGYQALRRVHMAQGLQLMDVLLTDGDRVRSLAIGCDPDPIWFDEFPVAAA